MARIPDEIIDTIREQADIVDLVSDYVTLKKSGKNYQGLCPFHNEKTPSFSVNPERQIFHCFGCGKGGNVFKFLMEHEKVTFVEAVHHIAKSLHIAIPETARDQKTSSEAENLARVTQFAAKFFHEQLLNSDEGAPVRQYVVQRGLSDTTVHTFLLGHAPDSWDALLTAARHKDISPAWLEKAGLAKTNGNRFYDAFRNRLIFPIFSPSGRVVGFGGRALSDEDQPKYLNSPESPIYQKSRVAYGLFQTKDAIRRDGRVVIVEGYMDLISLYQSGIETVAATCGTALTPDHARLLARYAQQAFLAYDSDEAGTRAAVRGLEPLVVSGLWTRIVQLPEGDDPDTYVQAHGTDGFMAQIEQASTIADFMASQYDISDPRAREDVFRGMTNLIKKTSNLVHREQYKEEAERRFPALQNLLASELQAPRFVGRDYNTPQPDETQETKPRNNTERELIQLMLHRTEITELVDEQLEPGDFTDETCRFIAEQCFVLLSNDGPADPATLMDRIDNEEAVQVIAELINAADSGTNFEQRAWDHIIRIKQNQLKREMARLMEQIKQMEQSASETLPETMAAYLQLKQQEKTLLQSAPQIEVGMG